MTRERMRSDALAIFRAALEAVEGGVAVARILHRDGAWLACGAHRWDLRDRRVVVLGAGKAGAAMAAAVSACVGPYLTGGLVITKAGHGRPIRGVDVREGGHPLPDAAGAAATAELLALAGGLDAEDLAVCVLSGGGSALLAAPVPGVSLAALRRVTDALLRAGADIRELNTVRRALSAVAGGGLLRALAPADVLTLALSDVPDDDPKLLASGPTTPWEADPAAARAVLDRYGIDLELPDPVEHDVAPAPWVCVGSLLDAIDAGAAEARRLGWGCDVERVRHGGEARALGGALVGRLARGRCRVAGGEPTVAVRGGGRGGRAQEVALAAAGTLGTGQVLLAAGTDGTDGPTDAAGAIVDWTSVSRARRAGFDPHEALDRNDAYPLLEATGDLLRTGPTDTNVGDLYVGISAPRA